MKIFYEKNLKYIYKSIMLIYPLKRNQNLQIEGMNTGLLMYFK